jgi:hypothetical protein
VTCSSNAEQVLFEAEIRISGETVWVRTQRIQEIFDFLLRLASAGTWGHVQDSRAALTGLHFLLPGLTLNREGAKYVSGNFLQNRETKKYFPAAEV